MVVQSRREMSRLTPPDGVSYRPGSLGQRPHHEGSPSSATSRSDESIRNPVRRYGISPTTMRKWRKRETTAERSVGPAEPHSTVLTIEQAAMIVASRRHTRLLLDDRLCALQPPIQNLTCSSLHCCRRR